MKHSWEQLLLSECSIKVITEISKTQNIHETPTVDNQNIQKRVRLPAPSAFAPFEIDN